MPLTFKVLHVVSWEAEQEEDKRFRKSPGPETWVAGNLRSHHRDHCDFRTQVATGRDSGAAPEGCGQGLPVQVRA